MPGGFFVSTPGHQLSQLPSSLINGLLAPGTISHKRATNPQGSREAMASRLNKRHQDEVRTRIQTSQLINVLQDHALSAESEISPSRMKAIEILLKKSLPDLSAVEVSGDEESPVRLVFGWKSAKS
jgi:hypothetical protein